MPGMPHYVFTVRDDAEPLGAAFDVTEADARRIADRRTRDRGGDLGDPTMRVRYTEVGVLVPPELADGDVVTGEVAKTLPCGSSIERVRRADGVAVRSPGAMLKTSAGWVTGDNRVSTYIPEADEYRVHKVGRPMEFKPKSRR
jgi:hypothetical protein